jgi:hypothetical protein
VGINLDAQTGVPGIYTSANAAVCTLSAETDLGISLYISDSNYEETNIVDMEFDGTKYYLLFNHDEFITGLNKGAMILTSSDLVNFTLHETGIRFNVHDLVVEDGTNNLSLDKIATHAAY